MKSALGMSGAARERSQAWRTSPPQASAPGQDEEDLVCACLGV